MRGSENLLPLANALAGVVREAGALARAASGSPVKTWVKDHNSPVSEVDIAVNQLLKERLATIVPEAGWLSEESEDGPARLAASRVWIVDPIDGTRSFIAGRPDWTISVALVESRRPIVAALYAPISEELFLAVAGAGATRKRHANCGICGRHARRGEDCGPEGISRPPRRRRSGIHGSAQDPFAGVAARPRRRRHARCGDSKPHQPRLGSCRCRSFGARSRGRADHGRWNEACL